MQISGLNVGYLNICKSWQGEGPFAGQRIVVLRFNVCNLKCRWNTVDGGMAWCDTKKTWDGSETGENWDVDKLIKFVLRTSRKRIAPAKWEKSGFLASFKRAEIVMVTGGEPMLRQSQPAFQKLIEGLHDKGMQIHFETNGTRPPNEWACKNIDFFDMSPKYQLYPKEYTKEKMKKWADCGVPVAWKFVVGHPSDVEKLREWLEQMEVPLDADIWLMPLTLDDKSMKDSEQLIKGNGLDEAYKSPAVSPRGGYKNVRISPRLQISGGFP